MSNLTKSISADERKMLRKAFWRSFTLYAAVSPAKQGASGFSYAMMPFIDKFYKNDEKGRKTVVDFINTTSRIYPVGRLDYDTSGILILTNDGELANLLMRPDSLVDKTYIVKVNGEVTIKDVQQLRNGVIIDGIKTKKARVKLKSVDKKKSTSILEITIHEGKNHQIKKMFESLGYKVTKLRREKYANLDLKGLLPGEYRPLTVKEVKILYSLCKKK